MAYGSKLASWDGDILNSKQKGARGEIWKPIVNYEGLYKVSSLGQIKSLPKYNSKVEKILKPVINPRSKRVSVMLCKNPTDRKRISIHRLVALAFLENPNNYPEINHKDENPQNNNVENLEWCDRKYNMNYGTTPKRLNLKNKKPVFGFNETQSIYFESIRSGKEKGFDGGGIIKSIKLGIKYKGLYWRYAICQ